MIVKNTVTLDRGPQIEKLKLEIGTATNTAQQAGVQMPDIVLALLQRADELCAVAEDVGTDMSKLSTAFGDDNVI
jgi:hypothetical protein